MYRNPPTVKIFLSLSLVLLFTATVCRAQKQGVPTLSNVGVGWANNSVNAVIFRKNSLVTFRDTQFIAYYGQDSYVVVGKRRRGNDRWILKKTSLKGNASDAHNTISIMADGAGFLHLSWDHHNNPLRYCRSDKPFSLNFNNAGPMTGALEEKVTYPEFLRLPDGDLLFLYRSGQSGQGNLVMNRYNLQTRQWMQVHSNLIDGEGKRNAYWQSFVDKSGTIHLSWVWRESPDVASNHDMCYARSRDGGKTWERSTGQKYALPITAKSAEYACHIPQNSELINQTSMYADANGVPFIASYWREPDSSIPQYHIVYKVGNAWKTLSCNFRKTAFSLSGAGTKRIPIARPQLVVKESAGQPSLLMIFRDEERGSKASAMLIPDLSKGIWKISDLTSESLGSWEPTYDTELWKEKGILSLFVQKVEQIDGEGKAQVPPTMVKVLQWKPF